MALVILLASRYKFFAGLQFYLVGLMYSILRFMVDFSRHYADNERLGGLSHNQVVCIILFVTFTGLIAREVFNRNQTTEEAPNPEVAKNTEEPPAQPQSNENDAASS